MREHIQNNRGFTWVELLVVLVIMGIISAVAASRLMVDDPDLAAQAEVLKVDLRYAQLRSMNTDTIWYIQFEPHAYALHYAGTATPVLLPGKDSPLVALPAGMTLNYSSGSILSFDSRGRPCTDPAGMVLQTGDRTIQVVMGSQVRAIVITQNTGFIR